jgi:hypothetical protein
MPSRLVSKVRINISELSIETIVFDMDNTIMTTMYKKNEIQEYDAATYVKLFGHSALKVREWFPNLNLDILKLSSILKGDAVRAQKE